jgi:protein gp37
MGTNSKIEWTDSTFNPWIGCTNVSPGCDHCYAEAQNKYRGWTEWGPRGKRRRTSSDNWKKPLRWNADAEQFQREHGRRQRVFCASLADVFDNKVPVSWRIDLFKLIMQTPELDWQLLTKRPQNVARFLPADWDQGYPNVWLGITAENEMYYRQRWPILAKVPAAVRFVSYEPAVGPLGNPDIGLEKVPDWIISRGESGPKARLMSPNWARDIVAHCERLGIAAFHKQWGIYGSNPLVAEKGMTPAQAAAVDKYGKGGGLLDGRLQRDFPKRLGRLSVAA